MFFTNGIKSIGLYFILLRQVFRRPENIKVYIKAFWTDIELLGLNSLGIVSIISLFVGAVVTIQTAFNLNDPLIPNYYVGIATRESIILEFSPTIISLILAGKVGSNIASTMGSMRVSEQIDALEIMGINSASYLILPKIIALIIFNPILIILSMFLGILGGYIAATLTGVVSPTDFLVGIQSDFNSFYIVYSLIKTIVFAFVITTVSAYFGYFVKGGAVEVGINATKAVVSSSIAIIIANYILTQILLG